MRFPFISLIAAGSLALGGCAYGGLGLGLGYGDPYSSYGYGYGSPYYGAGYGSPYGYGSYGGYGYGGYGSSYYGWNGSYYYPGSGYYVYDSYRRPFPMTATQRQYWSTRSPALGSTSTVARTVRPNWTAFNQRAAAREERRSVRDQRRIDRRNNR